MGALSIWHWLIVLVVAMVLFGGGGKIPRLMGDVAKGIRSFKSNMKDDSEATADNKKIDEGVNLAREDEAAKS